MHYGDNILKKVQKPARYTGGEWNMVSGNWEEAEVRIALSYPDVYEVGMSSITVPVLYHAVNKLNFALAERVFAPWPDMEQQLRQAGECLLSLETGRPIKDFDLVGFSLGYELTYTNILNILNLGGLPVMARDRGEGQALVMAGGIGALNPEPLVDFIDFFVIGDGEAVISQIASTIRECKAKGASRNEMLLEISGIEGIYVPSYYHVEYDKLNRFKNIRPSSPGAPLPVERVYCTKLPPPPLDPIVPLIETVQDRSVVEISRGCTRGCRFCNAGIYYRPLRHRSAGEIQKVVEELNQSCGYDNVTLLSLSSGDHPQISEIINRLSNMPGAQDMTLSLPSLRVDGLSLGLVEKLPGRRKSGLTLAPEAATQRLQGVINKIVPEEEILDTCSKAFERGWTTLKLYFMLGLPTETDEDLEGITSLVYKIYNLTKLAPGRRPHLRLSLSTFVPKAHTPFQWVGQISREEIMRRVALVKNGINRKGVKISYQSPEQSLLEAVFSRGDRRLGCAIHHAWEMGARFDGWDEWFDFNRWQQAFEYNGVDPAFYANRQLSLDEPLPWGHIDSGVSRAFLLKEYQRALEGITTPDCRVGGCNYCGLQIRTPECHSLSREVGQHE